MENNITFQDLDLNNAFLFAATAKNPEVCQIILEIALGHSIPKVKVHAEHTVLYSSDFKSIRLDVYGEDEVDVRYDLESQNEKKNLPKRSRYYQAELDVSSLKPGEDYSNLKPLYIIFICTFDPFDRGFYRYTFEPICKEDRELMLDDETCRVFLNTKGKNNEDVPEELVEFLHYMENSTDQYIETKTHSKAVRKIHDVVKQVKKSAKLEEQFMRGEELLKQREQMGREAGLAEGREVGLATGLIEGRRESLIIVLQNKGVVSQRLSEKLESQSDLEVLNNWLALACKASDIEEFERQISDDESEPV